MTTGATGGKTTKQNNGQRGGKRRRERDARAGKVNVDMELGRGNLGGGGRGGTTAINGTRVNNTKYRPESSV